MSTIWPRTARRDIAWPSALLAEDAASFTSPADAAPDLVATARPSMAVHTIGGVVTPAQQLRVIVPSGGRLEIEAELASRDVGFVHAGQAAVVKVEAFTFTRYGLLRGTVEGVSRDAVMGAGPGRAAVASASVSASRSPLSWT